ncbi:hypothetical protein [Cotesia plutellae polydnavirus]|nr:hypothetical protein [Cotesia plutellae polydnavirus]
MDSVWQWPNFFPFSWVLIPFRPFFDSILNVDLRSCDGINELKFFASLIPHERKTVCDLKLHQRVICDRQHLQEIEHSQSVVESLKMNFCLEYILHDYTDSAECSVQL